MALGPTAILALAAQCAPAVSPQVIAAIVDVESKGYVFAINVNRLSRQPSPPRSAAEATRVAQYYIARGHSVDLGLGQINSRNMRWLGLTWDSVFDPCTNVAAAGTVLAANYRAVRNGRHPQIALRIALSLYNTGHRERGFRNGYVRKVERAGYALAGQQVSTSVTVAYLPFSVPSPARDGGERETLSSISLPVIARQNLNAPPVQQVAVRQRPPEWDVFARAQFAATAKPNEEN